MANIFKTLKQGRQKVVSSPFDSPININNFEDLEVIKPLEKRPRRRSTLEKNTILKRISQVTTRDKIYKKDEKPDESSEEEIEQAPIPEELLVDACEDYKGDSMEIDKEWIKLFPKKQDRFSFFWWGDQVQTPVPYPPSLELKMKQVALGGRHAIALSCLGQVYTWGNGSSGQLGHGNTESCEHPKLVEALAQTKIRKICSMAAQSAALASNGELYSWGWNGASDVATAPKLSELNGWTILQVVLGAYHTTVLVTGDADKPNEVFSWGRGSKGQLGHGETLQLNTPTSIEALKNENVVLIASGETHTVCTTAQGRVFAWGANELGCLGVGSEEDFINVPTPVTDLDNIRVIQLSCGLGFTAALSSAGAVFTWGRNQHGQLGRGTACSSSGKPQQIKQLSNISIEGILCSNDHMLAWTDKNTLFTWGSSRNNRLGFETDKQHVTSPHIIEGLKNRPIFGGSTSSRAVIIYSGEQMFGVPLENCMLDSETLPAVVDECLSFLQGYIREEGLFRISPAGWERDTLISWWNEGYHVNLSNSPCPHLIASLLKHFISSLPEPLMTFKLYDNFISLETESTDFLHLLEGYRVLLRNLPKPNRFILCSILELLVSVHKNRDASRMDAKNLAVVFAPGLFRSPPNCETTAKNIQAQVKLTKKLIKYYSALFAENSSEMLSNMCSILLDTKSSKEEIHKQQKKIWHACVRSLNDPTAAFVTTTQSSGSFSEVLFESDVIDKSIQSAILQFPLPDSLVLLEQLLSLLSEIPISTTISLIEGLHFVELPEDERACISGILSSYKDISNFADSAADSEIDWSNVTLTQYSVDDEDLRSQLEEAERAALLLRQAEQDRQRNSSRGPSSPASMKLVPVASIFAFMNNQQKEFQSQLEEMERNQANAEKGKITLDPQQERLEQCIASLQDESAKLALELEENRQKLASVEEDLARHAKESSIEQQRYRDELEGIDSNIERKEETLQLVENTATKFNGFLDGPFALNNSRLMELKATIVRGILENTAECPVLIYRYLDACAHLLSELRKKMKRARKDIKRITKSYGEEAAAAIYSEYKRFHDIHADILAEMEEAAAVYRPILQPVLDWIEFCREKAVDPSTPTLLDEYINSAHLNTTSIMKDFLLVLLQGFGIFPDPGATINVTTGGGKKIKLANILAKQETIEDHLQTIKRRYKID